VADVDEFFAPTYIVLVGEYVGRKSIEEFMSEDYNGSCCKSNDSVLGIETVLII